MTITKNLNGDQLELKLDGRLDTLTAPELEEEIKANADSIKDLIIDMKDLEYISSAGLRALLVAKKLLHGKGTVKAVNTNDMVKEVFEVTGFIDLIDIE